MRPLLLSAAVAACLTCFPSHPALGAETDEGEAAPRTELQPILVIGSPPATLPANAASLDQDALRGLRVRSQDTASLLDGIPGLSRQSAGGVASIPVVRGLAGDRNRILVDGMDFIASCPNHMNPPLSYIDPAKLGAVRVYAGIAPVSAGGDSIGGSIVVDSRPARFGNDGDRWQTRGEIGAQARSNGDARSADASLNLANERIAVSYDGSVARSDNVRAGGAFRDFRATGREGHALAPDIVASSAYLLRTHTLGAALRGERHLLQASLGHQDMPFQGFPNQRMDLTGNRQTRLLLRYAGDYDWGQLDARAWGERVTHRMDFGPDRQFWYGPQAMLPGVTDHTRPCSPIGTTCAAGMPMLAESRSRGLGASATLPASVEGLLRLGAELQHYRLDDWWPPSGGGMWPGSFWNIRNGRRDRQSAFIEWEGKLDSRWSALAGLRYTRIVTDAGPVQGYAVEPIPGSSYAQTAADAATFNAAQRRRTDGHLDLSLLARYEASERSAFELGYARKIRSPNLYERYAWSRWSMAAAMNNTVGDGNGYVGDPALKPETAHTLSASVVWRGSDPEQELTLTPFLTGIDGFIDAVALSQNGPGRFNVLRYANQRARLRGVELEAATPLARAAHGDYHLRLVASHLRARNRDTGAGLYHAMPDNLRLQLSHRRGGWEGMAEWVAVAAKSRLSEVRNEVPTAGHALLNLQGVWRHGAWRFERGVDNVFDRLYEQPLGGFYVAQGRSMGINAIPHGIAVPGAGRSVRAGLSRSF
jgi:iron complex outermembrane recepter protein